MKYLKYHRLKQFLGRDRTASVIVSMGANAEILSASSQIEYDVFNDTLIISTLEKAEDSKAQYKILAINIRESGGTEISDDFKFINCVRAEGRSYLVFFKKLN